MTSSLAAQIAQSASLNSALLVDRSRRKPTESYLFTSREADQQDLDSIHALGVNAYSRLKYLNHVLGLYENALFSDAAKVTDRTLQTADANAKLDRALNSFLPLLGPYLLESTTGKVVEWLVRRFRIHEFNTEAVLALFLPYYDAPHFAKMLSILHIKNKSKLAALLPYKSTNTPLTHNAIVMLMMQPMNSDLTRFIGNILPTIMSSPHAIHAVHRALIAMHTGVLLEYTRRSFGVASKGKSVTADEVMLAWILPTAMEPLQLCAQLEVESSKENIIAEVILSSYLLLSAISHTCPLSSKALNAILKSAATCAHRVSAKQAVRTLASICAGQSVEVMDEKPLSKSVIRALLQLSGVVNEIQESLAFAGTDRFAAAFGKSLISRLDETQPSDLLIALLTLPDLPLKLVQDLSRELILLHVESTRNGETRNDTLSARTRSLLVHVQQRYPVALQSISEQFLKETEDQEIVEQLLLSLSVALPISSTGSAATSAADIDVVVASTSADASVRAIAVRQLYDRLSEMDLPETERDAVRSALIGRVQDSDTTVLGMLYAELEQFLSLVLNDASAYVDIMALVLLGPSTPSRNSMKSHMTFVLKHLYPALVRAGKVNIATQIVDKVIFPYLLFSKPRQKTVNIVWDLLDTTEGEENSVGRCELLAGCVDAVKWEQAKNKSSEEQQHEEGYQNTQMMARVNIAMAAKIAGNIFASTSTEQYFSGILTKLCDSNPHLRALAFLICRALLGYLSGERLVDASHRVLNAMQLKTLEGMDEFMKGSDNLQAFLHDASLSTAIVLKPNKLHTLHRLQVAILTGLPLISRPANITAEWLSNIPSKADSSDLALRYVELMRAVYALANSTANLPTLSAHLIRAVFISLGDDVLKFLAGIWLHSDPVKQSSPAEHASLRHAAAFLEAHYASQRCIDFQVVLPTFMVALAHNDQRARQAALECISALVRTSQLQSPTGVYAFDAIYGASSADLQYLDWVDICQYIQALQACKEHLLTDPSYLPVIHQQSLVVNKVDAKSEAGYKQRVLCYMLSHVVACPLAILKLRLLKSLEVVSHSVKSQMLQPILQAFTNETALSRMTETFGAEYEDFATLVVGTLDETSSTLLNKDEGFWTLYKAVLRHFFQPGALMSPRRVLSQRLQSVVFASLQPLRKLDICRILLDVGQHPDVTNDARNLLARLLNEVPVMVQLLTSLQPAAADGTQRVKRAKLDSRDVYPSLTLLTEALGGKTLPGSVELLSCLLETLSKIIHDTSPVSDKTYIEQLLMTALEGIAVNVTTASGLTSAVRLDILVELIRVSENPQTFNQALLLMAALARLAPGAILQNIMPIFTFMGSNVFHRDDAYSFRVIQKTIDSIVPVMVSSLKQLATNNLDLYIAARDFLQVFAGAANHIPRHRRTGFFGHFIDALGPKDFLAPVCMLLIDKSANKVARQSLEESVNTLSLPVSALQRYAKDLQLPTIVEVLYEVQRLIDLELGQSSSEKTFLEPQRDEESSTQHIARRQAFALLIFVSLAMKQLSSAPSLLGAQPTTELLRVLLDIRVSKAGRLSELAMNNIPELAGSIIEDVLMIMSAGDFINGVVTVMESGEATIQCGALDFLAAQLANVADKIRQEARASVAKIIEFCRILLSSMCPDALREASLHALGAIANTVSPGEEHALTSTVPVVLKTVKERQSTRIALDVLLAQSYKLGPRLIPYFKDIIRECIGVLRSDNQGEDIGIRAVGLLRSLLNSIPNFWGSIEFMQVINLYLDACALSSKALLSTLSPLVKAVTKKAPSKLLLTTLCDLWPSLKSEVVVPRLQGYFMIMKRTIHVADRSVISEHLRTLYKVFLEFYELCAEQATVRDSVETDGITAFLELIVKLNETLFKPMFRRMFDWAFTDDANNDSGKRVVFCQVYMTLVDYFKILMTPYMSFLLQPFIEMLKGFSQSLDSTALWLAVIQTLTKTLTRDEKAYWRDEKVQQLLEPLVAQVPVAAQSRASEETSALTDCLLATAEVLSDDTLLKNLNINILMYTRSEDSRVRLYALSCSESLWRAHGEKLIGFSTETATFIAECAEDNNDSVVREAHRLKSAVESVAGRIEV